MHPVEIKRELRKQKKNGIRQSMAAIARELECSRVAVRLVIEGKSVSAKIMEAVSNALGIPKEQIWPNYFEKKAAHKKRL